MRPRYGTRKTTRVPGFDYRQPGPYFVTICTQNRQLLFGWAQYDGVQRSAAGHMVADVWRTAPDVFPGVELDAFVVMPNHVHAILTLGTGTIERNPTLGDVMKWFKTLTTVEYVKGVMTRGWPRFHDRLWQHRSYDHIIRNDADLDRVRAYIEVNPWKWDRDNLYIPDYPAAPDRTATRAVPTDR